MTPHRGPVGKELLPTLRRFALAVAFMAAGASAVMAQAPQTAPSAPPASAPMAPVETAPRPDAASAVTATDAGADRLAETADVTAQDARLVRQLLARFSRIESLRNVGVDINAGVATLTGEVATEEDRQRARSLAQELPGVVEVDNQLRLDTSLAVRLRPALARAAGLAQQVVEAVPLIVLALLLIWLVSALGRWLSERQVLHRMVGHQPFMVEVLRQTVRVGAVLLGVVIALDLLDATALVQAVIGTAGIVGLALGFALRDVVENYIAGLLLSVRQPFALNDHVVIEGHEGKVASLTTRATSLITLDGNHLRLPNSLVFKGVIVNYTRNPQRRFSFRVGVGVNENLHHARAVGVEALSGLPGVLANPAPAGAVVQLADSSVTMEFSGWFDQRQSGFFRLRSDAITAVKAALDSKGVDLPDPTYRVRVLTQGEAESPAPASTRSAQRAPATPSPGFPAGDSTNDDPLSDERAVERQVADEQVLTAGSNLLKSNAPRE